MFSIFYKQFSILYKAQPLSYNNTATAKSISIFNAISNIDIQQQSENHQALIPRNLSNGTSARISSIDSVFVYILSPERDRLELHARCSRHCYACLRRDQFNSWSQRDWVTSFHQEQRKVFPENVVSLQNGSVSRWRSRRLVFLIILVISFVLVCGWGKEAISAK